MDYLGNKRAIAGRVVAAVEGGREDRRGLRVLDAFSGTAAVSTALRARGHRVLANDNLELCAAWARAALLVPAHPAFAGLQAEFGLAESTAYAGVVAHLDALAGTEGFATRSFSPASVEFCGVERRYLTHENARRVDAIRAAIERWQPRLTEGEHGLLLATLVDAVMRVSNTAGTYGCYLKGWKGCALDPLTLKTLSLPDDDDPSGHRVTCDDAVAVAAESDVDVLYADPPYTKRQYAAYYHVLETIVRNDEPPLTGSTGLRPWQTHASDWCYKRRAPAALEALVTKSSAERIVLSYSEDGQIDHNTLLDLMSGHGSVSFKEFGLRRYRSSRLPHKGDTVIERIYMLER